MGILFARIINRLGDLTLKDILRYAAIALVVLGGVVIIHNVFKTFGDLKESHKAQIASLSTELLAAKNNNDVNSLAIAAMKKQIAEQAAQVAANEKRVATLEGFRAQREASLTATIAKLQTLHKKPSGGKIEVYKGTPTLLQILREDGSSLPDTPPVK